MMLRETQDLILKKAEPNDWRDLYENLWSHEESARYMLWNVTKSEEDAQIRIRKTIEHQKKTPYAYTVYEKKTGNAIGFAGMTQIDEGTYEDTGIAIGPSFVRKGYGKQMLTELVRIAFEELDAREFMAACRSGNNASGQLQLSCGFHYSHSENKVDPRNGEGYVLEYYKLKSENRKEN